MIFMGPLRTPPAIFDNLERLSNPFQLKYFSAAEFFEEIPVVGAEINYEHAWKFVFSYNGSCASRRRDDAGRSSIQTTDPTLKASCANVMRQGSTNQSRSLIPANDRD